MRVEPRASARSADIIILAHRAAHWRRMTAIAAAIAALLAVYVAVSRIAPDLVPAPLRGTQVAAHAPAAPGRSQQDRLVAVLQQEPTAPAFLLTLDTRTRALTVRRVAATPEAGRSYQLWLIAKQFPNPQSLGVVGENEFTQRALPANYDLETLRTASYAVSLEPAGGSPNSGPTGPVLFTGKAVESCRVRRRRRHLKPDCMILAAIMSALAAGSTSISPSILASVPSQHVKSEPA